MSGEELKPCPFCGGDAHWCSTYIDADEPGTVTCANRCGATVICSGPKAVRIAAWNRRHPLPEQPQEGVRELIAWLEALSEKQRHERGCAFYFGEPDPQIAQCIAALSPPSTETKESGE